MKIENNGNKQFLLVVPPMRSIYFPALGVSLLKANIEKCGIGATVHYSNLFFVEQFGLTFQLFLSEPGALISEYMFSHWLFKRTDADVEKFARQVEKDYPQIFRLFKAVFPSMNTSRLLSWFVKAAGTTIDRTVREIIDSKASFAGFSSNMAENCFCLSVIQRLKEIRPDIVTIMGGANCNAEMGEELFMKFPQIDYVCQGEADISLVNLITSLTGSGKRGEPIPGVLAREYQSPSGAASMVTDLDQLPDPDFRDYFEQRSRVPIMQKSKNKYLSMVTIPLETSRGCWWGARHRCSFCGLNPFHNEFRSKSAPHALRQVAALAREYRAQRIQFVDNLPDYGYFNTFFPELGRNPVAELFFETTGSLSRRQVELMSQAGVGHIQPGIESLNEQSLKLMGKCTSPLSNLQTLKWCTEFGINPEWNYLSGVPGEQGHGSETDEALLNQVTHLIPPMGPHKISLQRFSRYFDSPRQYGLDPVMIDPLYKSVYSLPEESLKRILYFFDAGFFRSWSEGDSWKSLTRLLEQWRKVFWRSHLVCFPGRTGSLLIDTRPNRKKMWVRLSELESKIYEQCEKNRTPEEIQESLAARSEADVKQIESVLNSLVEKEIVLCRDGRYLGLAVKVTRNQRKKYREFEQNYYYFGHMADLPWQDIVQIRKQFGIRRWTFLYSVGLFFALKMKIGLWRFRFRLSTKAIHILAALFSDRNCQGDIETSPVLFPQG